MVGRRARRVLLAVIAAVLGLTLASAALPAAADESPKILLVLDVSGSMNGKIPSGGTKFAAAKRALKEVAGALPAGTQVGLRVYGSEIAEDQSKNPRACTDTKLVLPIGPLDQAKMNRAVDSFTAKGETPIAYSLGKAVDDLGDSGKRVMILISDGQETCAKDPCPTARKLAASGVDLQFNAIGLAVNSKARKQLQCIADAGDGSYYDADDTDGLTDAVRKLAQRALRPYQITGTPVSGTATPAGSPQLRPGQYRDRYQVSPKPRYYTINRTPGASLTASITSLIRPYTAQNGESWTLKLTTADGQACDSRAVVVNTFRATTVVSGAVGVSPLQSNRPPGGPCDTAPQLLLSLSRGAPPGQREPVPVEIVVSEEPPVTNVSTLPDPLTSYTGTGKAVGTSKPVQGALGGSSFSNAPLITAGSWSDSLAVGETVFYKVHLEPGQRLRSTAVTPASAKRWQTSDNDGGVLTYLTMYSPARVQLVEKYKVLGLQRRVEVSAASPEVRVRNAERPRPSFENIGAEWSTASTAGDYLVGLQLAPSLKQLTGRVMPVQLNVAVDGQPNGLPQHASASASPPPSESASSPAVETPTASPAGGSTTSGRGGTGLVLGLAAAALLLAAGVAVAFARRSRGRSEGSSPDLPR